MEVIVDNIVDSLLKKNMISKEEYSDVHYGLQLFLLTLFDVIVLLTVGLSTGFIKEILLFTAGFFPLKIYAGGYHATTPLRCIIIYLLLTFFSILLSTLLIKYFLPVTIILILIAGFNLYFNAPAESIYKPLDQKQQKHSRKMTFVVFFSQIVIYLIMIAINVQPSLILILLLGIWMESNLLVIKERGGKYEETND